jgi:hypothetical protein
MPKRKVIPYATAGEQLVHHLSLYVLNEVPWNDLSNHLILTAREAEFSEFVREVVLIHLACRLISAGTSIMMGQGTNICRNADDPVVQSRLKEYIRNILGISSGQIDGVMAYLTDALIVTNDTIKESVDKPIRGKAKRLNEPCYMCGKKMDFRKSNPDKYDRCTLDHIWPRCYGGDSEPENLLPACDSCNSHKKKNLAAWAMSSIQALHLGFDPSDRQLENLEGEYKFAIHNYAARKLAAKENLSLKQAFIKLGPWTDLRLKREDDVGDFFNLLNHNQRLAIE